MGVCPETTESNRVRVEVGATAYNIDHIFGLFVDFLLHKVADSSFVTPANPIPRVSMFRVAVS